MREKPHKKDIVPGEGQIFVVQNGHDAEIDLREYHFPEYLWLIGIPTLDRDGGRVLVLGLEDNSVVASAEVTEPGGHVHFTELSEERDTINNFKIKVQEGSHATYFFSRMPYNPYSP